MALNREPRPAWLCTDCMLSREIGTILTPLRPAEPTPLSLMENPAELTRDACDPACEDYGCGCIREFDKAPCDGCGSRLAGSRYRYADWSIQ